ncbi:hypothetical protein ACFQ7M_12110 [Streptomyces massasporeus]
MSVAAAVMYWVAGALEIVGLVVTIVDITRARTRLAGYLTRPRNVYASDSGAVGEAFDATVVTSEAKTLEQRVEDLENWKRSLPGALDEREEQIRVRLESRFQQDLETARKNVEDQYTGLREYIEGSQQKWWESYRGPLLLIVGVLVGTIANFVALGA